jgi:hypothetical protein
LIGESCPVIRSTSSQPHAATASTCRSLPEHCHSQGTLAAPRAGVPAPRAAHRRRTLSPAVNYERPDLNDLRLVRPDIVKPLHRTPRIEPYDMDFRGSATEASNTAQTSMQTMLPCKICMSRDQVPTLTETRVPITSCSWRFQSVDGIVPQMVVLLASAGENWKMAVEFRVE